MDPLDLQPQDIRIGDIAHALSNLCRFTGHVRRFYSVAEHCVRVSYMVSEENALWGLLHDATEAYVNDVSHPLKQQEELQGYKAIEAKVSMAIAQRFHLPLVEPNEVRLADREACRQEGSVLVPGWPEAPTSHTFPVVPGLPPKSAKRLYLDRFSELTGLGI